MLLRTLGRLALDGSAYPHTKPLLLLSYLSLSGPQERRRLATLFWPRATDPLNRLSVTLSRLRKAVPGAVVADLERVATMLDTDAATVLAALAAGSDREAIEAYAGGFLQGVRLRGVEEELEEWILDTRERLARGVQQCCLALAETHLAAGRHPQAVAAAERTLELAGSALLEPEQLRRLHRVLHAGASPRAAEVARDASALGLDLDRATPAGRSPPRLAERGTTNLRPRGTSFLGRREELHALEATVARPGRRLVTLTGAGGIGKSRLAMQLVVEQLEAAAFEDGVFFVALEDLVDDGAVPHAVAEAVGLTLPAQGSARDVVVGALAPLHALLVLDNLEHLPAAAGFVAELLARAPRLRLLATSRHPLRLEEEWIVPLRGLPSPADDAGDDALYASPAVELFSQRARRVAPAFALTPREAREVAGIARMTGGSPLALELASGWVGVMPVREIAAEIRRDLDFLTTPTRNVPERHRSLRAVFEHSWRLLDPREQACLRRLSVFRGGFRREGARRVADADLGILASLMAKSLLIRAPDDRFGRHPLIQRFTEEALARHPEEREHVRARHAAHVLALAEEAQQHLDGLDGGRWLERMEAEHANLRAALAWAEASDDPTLLLRLACAAVDYWIRCSHHAEAAGWFRKALARADAIPDRRLRAVGMLDLSFLSFLRGEPSTSQPMLVDGLALARRLGDQRLEVRARTLLGMLATYQCDYPAARAHYGPALELARASGDRGSQARLLNNLGDAWAYHGEPRTARPYYEEGVALERELGNHQMVSNVLGSLAVVLVELDELGEARRMLRESVELVRTLGIRYSLPTALEQVAILATAAGRPLEAARLWGAAEAMRRRIEAPLEPFAEPQHSAAIARARALIDASSFEAAWRRGARMSPDEAVDSALAEGLAAPGAHPARSDRAADAAGGEDGEPLDPHLS